MSSPYVTDAFLKGRIAHMLHKSSSELISLWDDVVTDVNQSAHDMIVSKLATRGFTVAQIDQWDRRAEFNRQIGMYMGLVNGTTAEAYDDKWPEKLKYWIDQLDEVPVLIGDVLQQPSAFSVCGRGEMATAADEFVKDNAQPTIPHDEVGDPTRW